jgi:hypothetical protein
MASGHEGLVSELSEVAKADQDLAAIRKALGAGPSRQDLQQRVMDLCAGGIRERVETEGAAFDGTRAAKHVAVAFDALGRALERGDSQDAIDAIREAFAAALEGQP